MKNLTLSTLFLFTILFTNAQTITSDWFFDIGDQETLNYIIDASSMEMPIEQLNGSWDFSNVVADSVISISYIDPAATSQSTNFPNATVVAQYNNENNFTFFEEDATSIKTIGGYILDDNNGNPIETLIEYEEEEILAETPWNIGESIFTSIVRAYTENGIQTSYDFWFSQSEIVGNGTVVTPNGTYSNCLMIKKIVEPGAGRTSLTNPLISLEYIFIKDKMSNQIARYVEDYDFYGGGATQVSFYYNESDVTINVNENSNLNIELLNSANNQLQIKSDKAFKSNIKIFNVSGKLLFSKNIQINKGNMTIDHDFKSLIKPAILIITDIKTGDYKIEKMMF